MNGFPGVTMEHLYVKFGDPSCIVFFRYHVEKQTYSGENPYPYAFDGISCLHQ